MPATNPSQTTRFGIYRWQLDTDTFKREHMDTSNQHIEDRGALMYQGTAKPGSANGIYTRAFWFDTTKKELWYSDYSDNNTTGDWRVIYKPGSTAQISALAILGTANAGSAPEFARADHTHAGPGFGAPNSIGSANQTGTATTVARSDHIHTLSAKVVLPAHVDDTVANDGLQRTDSGLQVKPADATISVSSSGVKVGTGFVDNSYTASGKRVIYTGALAPTGTNAATGDLFVDTTDPASSITGDQIKQYRTGNGWTSISITQRTPAAKFVWTQEFTSNNGGVTDEYYAVPFDAMQFPLNETERKIWYPGYEGNPTGIPFSSVTGYRAIRIPYSGFYMLHGNMAWVSRANGWRQLYIQVNRATDNPDTGWAELDGGQHVPDTPVGNYTRAMAWTFGSFDAGDLIQLVGRTYGVNAATKVSGANLSVTYISAR